MPLPPLTPEQRGASLSDVLKESESNETVGKMKVSALLEALPGVGKVRARQIMERIGIAETRRVRGLGANQVAALEREFGGWVPPPSARR